MGRSRENSVHGERIGKNPPSFGRKVSILVSNFCEGKGKEIIPLLSDVIFLSTEGKASFFLFFTAMFLYSEREEERERREGKREDRSKIVEMVRQRPSVGGAASRRT